VMGILGCLAVAIWLLFRNTTGSSRRQSREHHDRKRGAGRAKASPAATA
jgi:hypothetical protein